MLLLLFTAGCSCSDGLELVVDVKTDLVAGEEFDRARSELLAELPGTGPAVGARIQERPVATGEPFLTGHRVAEFAGLDPDDYVLRVQLLLRGGLVAEQIVRVRLESNLAKTVIIARDCRGVSCPGPADDPALVSCLGGLCVDPGCDALGGGECPMAECALAGDCPPLVPCAEPRCEEEGLCFYVLRNDRCASGERCDAEVGCVTDMPPPDGGDDAGPAMDASLDAGPPDAGGDSGPACTCTPDESRGTGSCDPCSEEICQGDCMSWACRLRSGNECDWGGGGEFRSCSTGSGATGSQFCLMSCVWSGGCCVLTGDGCNVTADCCSGTCVGGGCV